MKEVNKSILEVAHGELLKKVDYELAKVLANINDINTSQTKKRSIKITLNFSPVNERASVIMTSQVKTVLADLNPSEIILNNAIRMTEDGEYINVLQEISDIAPGQLNIDGEIHEPELIVIGHGAEKTINRKYITQEEI